MSDSLPTVSVESVAGRIHIVRGQRVVLDSNLAELYGVETRALIQAVKRNLNRFPSDFMFQLEGAEWNSLKSHFVTSKGRGGRRYLPFAFTEHGAIMAATVLNSHRAVEMSIFVVRTFVQLREMFSTHKELSIKLEELERRIGFESKHIEYRMRTGHPIKMGGVCLPCTTALQQWGGKSEMTTRT